jgi:hypothetical protein
VTDLAGFDACFAIGEVGVGQALQGRIEPLARDALRGVDLFLPGTPAATLDLNLEVGPNATISSGSVQIPLTNAIGDLRMSVLGQSMVTLPAGGTLPAGISSVPVSVGNISFSATLTLTIGRSGAAQQVTIGQTSVQVTASPPGGLKAAIKAQLIAQLTAILGGTGTIVDSQVDAQAGALEAAIPAELARVVRTRLQGLFPLRIDYALPNVSESTFCNIGLRDVRVALLPAGSATAACLVIATTLLPSSTGRLPDLGSPLPAGERAGLFFDNFFLASAVCCGLQSSPQFSGLGEPDDKPTRDAKRCGWKNRNVATVIDGRNFRIREASVTLDESNQNDKSFAVFFFMTTSDTGWDAEVRVNTRIRLRAENGLIVPVIERPDVEVRVSFAWWVWAIAILLVVIVAALVAVLAGAIGGAIAAFAGGAAVAIAGTALFTAGIAGGAMLVIGLVLMVIVMDAIAGGIRQTLQAAVSTLQGELERVRVIPQELLDAFGRLVPAVVHFDDLSVLGRVVVPPPPGERPLISVNDLVIQPGGGIDLDRGTTVAADDPDCDLEWGRLAPVVAMRMVGSGLAAGMLPSALSATWTAAMVPVGGTSYAGLTLAMIRRLPFPPRGGSIAPYGIPLAAQEPPQTLVFGARTGEGRYAKGSAWQDNVGRLHLRYMLFDTPSAIRLTHIWSRRQGPRVTDAIAFKLGPEGTGSRPPRLPQWDVVNICRLTATPVTLQPPVGYEWLWNGGTIRDGDGPLEGGIASVAITGPSCVLESIEGETLSGEVCVRGTDRFGIAAQICRDLAAAGRQSPVDVIDLGEKVMLEQVPAPFPVPPAGLQSGLAEFALGRSVDPVAVEQSHELDLAVQLQRELESLQAPSSRK